MELAPIMPSESMLDVKHTVLTGNELANYYGSTICLGGLASHPAEQALIFFCLSSSIFCSFYLHISDFFRTFVEY